MINDESRSRACSAGPGRLLESLSTGHFISEANLEAYPNRLGRSFTPANWERVLALRARWDPNGHFHMGPGGLSCTEQAIIMKPGGVGELTIITSATVCGRRVNFQSAQLAHFSTGLVSAFRLRDSRHECFRARSQRILVRLNVLLAQAVGQLVEGRVATIGLDAQKHLDHREAAERNHRLRITAFVLDDQSPLTDPRGDVHEPTDQASEASRTHHHPGHRIQGAGIKSRSRPR